MAALADVAMTSKAMAANRIGTRALRRFFSAGTAGTGVTGRAGVPTAVAASVVGAAPGDMAVVAAVAAAALATAAADATPIRVFYQVNAHPLYTINGEHYLSEVIEVCGGINIFADLSGLAPLISVESVLEREPEVILASSDAGTQAFDEWRRWSDMAAMQYGNLFLMPANEIGRATPRLLTGAAALCDALEKSRMNRRRKVDD